MNFLNMYSPFMMILTKIIDCIFLSILWIIFSIPIFTLGASTTALYYCAHKTLQDDRGYIFQEFFKAFKSNFKQSTSAFLIFLGIFLVLVGDLIILKISNKGTPLFSGLTMLFYMLLIFELFFSFYVFAYIGRFKNTLRNIFKNVLLINLSHLLKTMFMGMILIIGALIVWILPLFILIIPALATWLISYILESIYARYTLADAVNTGVVIIDAVNTGVVITDELNTDAVKTEAKK